MSIRATPAEQNRILNLDGPDGNAFVLIGLAINLGRQIGWKQRDIDRVIDEMQASTYYSLVAVFNYYYGAYIELHTTQSELITYVERHSNWQHIDSLNVKSA